MRSSVLREMAPVGPTAIIFKSATKVFTARILLLESIRFWQLLLTLAAQKFTVSVPMVSNSPFQFFDLIQIIWYVIVNHNVYVMKEIPFDDSCSLQQAQQEQALMAGVSHPNICRYVDSFIANGNNLYLIMEYCDRGDLEQFMQRSKGLISASN